MELEGLFDGVGHWFLFLRDGLKGFVALSLCLCEPLSLQRLDVVAEFKCPVGPGPEIAASNRSSLFSRVALGSGVLSR